MEARDRDRLEHLCRYAGRAAIAENRLSELPDGRVAYSLKKRWKDGTAHVVMTKQVLMERLCALVPRPRRHLVTYHGVFAPAAGIRRYSSCATCCCRTPPASVGVFGITKLAVRYVADRRRQRLQQVERSNANRSERVGANACNSQACAVRIVIWIPKVSR